MADAELIEALTYREVAWCELYVQLGDPQEAAKRAGWTKNPPVAAHILLGRQSVREYLRSRVSGALTHAGFRSIKVLTDLMESADVDDRVRVAAASKLADLCGLGAFAEQVPSNLPLPGADRLPQLGLNE